MRIPLSLSVYEHAAAFLGKTPWEVSRDADLVYEAHRCAYELYRHFPVVVGIDIYNLEAEAYGCEIVRPAGTGIPAITRPLFDSLDEALAIEAFDPLTAGRIPMMLEAAQRLQSDFPDADIRLPVSGPFSVAQNLLGLTPLILEVATRPQQVAEFLLRLVPGQVSLSRGVLDAGLGVAFFESAAAPPLLSPTQFRQVELPALKQAIELVSAEAGQALPCIIGGDTEPIIDAMMETGTGFLICPAETDRREFLEKMRAYPEVKVRVNLDPRLYTCGTREEILAEVDGVIELAGRQPNVLLGTGAIPYETPPAKLLLLKEYCD